MQQYIYGNIGHKDYNYVSSEPEFFSNAQRAAVLSHLMSYDVFCNHGELTTSAHQSFWMVVSNLDNPSAPDRLYLQASGGDPHRSGFYVRGYLSDRDDGYLYDSRLLQLLKARFEGFEDTMQAAETGSLKRVDASEIPLEQNLRPASLDSDLLQVVLLALMRKKKVIIRLGAVGAEAMKLSREYILAIYERLPYEQRKVNGFVTGISAGKLNDKNTLPASVTLMLMDGDADLGGMTSDMFTEVFDLADAGKKIRPMVRESKGKQLPYVELMDFLVQQNPEELDAFFRFCRSCMRDDVDGSNLGIQDYAMYLSFFNIGRNAFTDDSIRNWAANIYINARNNEKWTQDVKRALYERIASTLPAEQLEDYLCRSAQSFDDLKTFGVLVEGELKRAKSDRAEDAVRDENAALSLAMAEALMKHYPEGTRERLEKALTGRFLQLAVCKYPCLQEAQPMLTTVQALDQIALPENGKKTLPLVAAVRDQVNQTIRNRCDEIRGIYAAAYENQSRMGLEIIDRWPEQPDEGLRDLYGKLRSMYLFAELIQPGNASGWNDTIGGRILNRYEGTNPTILPHYEMLQQDADVHCKLFADCGGAMTQPQAERMQQLRDQWSHVLALGKQECSSMDQLLELFEQVNQTAMDGALADSMKERYTDTLLAHGVNREQILRSCKKICDACTDPLQANLLKKAISGCDDLMTIGKLQVDVLLKVLKALRALESRNLVEEPVRFAPWKKILPAAALLEKVSAYESYRFGMPEPDLSDRRVRVWAVESVRGNTDLMYLLARDYSEFRRVLVGDLAQKPGAISKDQILSLYVMGCPKDILCRGAEEKTAISWQQSIDELFPGWVELPAPVHMTLPSGLEGLKLLLIGEAVLLAIAGLIPGVLMLVTGAVPVLACIVIAAVLAVAALALFGISFASAKKAQRLFMRIMAAAMVPGILVTVVTLILNLK